MEFDLIIIGAGPGGYEAAAHAGRHGIKTLLIEKNELGGTCLNNGCIPVKTLLSSVHFYHDIRKKAGLFNITVSDVKLDYTKLIERKDRLLMRMRKGIEKLLADSNVTIIKGEATLVTERSRSDVSVNGETYTAKNIIWATGSVPGEIPGLAADGQTILNSDQILNLKTIPEKLDIVGAGVIGLEFADIFSQLGCQVTLYDIVDKLLPTEDGESIELLRKNLEKNGCVFKLGTRYEKTGNLVLIAAGRKIKKVTVNESLETETPGVYAIGDCNGLSFYAHSATYQGIKVVDNILANKKEKINLNNIPRVIFTSPQIASVGIMTERVHKASAALLGRAQSENKTDGFIKLFLGANQEIVGVTIVTDNADALIGEACVLVNKKITLSELKNIVHPHPTWSELFTA